MNKALVLAAPLVVLATACAAPSAGTRTVSAMPAGGTQYCMKDRLFERGNEMSCNWAPTFADACENINLSSINRGSVSGEPTNAGRCGNGQWLVSVTKKA